MADYTTRVEMHGATSEQYDLLHQRMTAAGFRRYLTGVSTDGLTGIYAIPSAEYDYTGQTSAKVVATLAYNIASGIRSTPAPWVLTTESATRYWFTTRVQDAKAA